MAQTRVMGRVMERRKDETGRERVGVCGGMRRGGREGMKDGGKDGGRMERRVGWRDKVREIKEAAGQEQHKSRTRAGHPMHGRTLLREQRSNKEQRGKEPSATNESHPPCLPTNHSAPSKQFQAMKRSVERGLSFSFLSYLLLTDSPLLSPLPCCMPSTHPTNWRWPRKRPGPLMCVLYSRKRMSACILPSYFDTVQRTTGAMCIRKK